MCVCVCVVYSQTDYRQCTHREKDEKTQHGETEQTRLCHYTRAEDEMKAHHTRLLFLWSLRGGSRGTDRHFFGWTEVGVCVCVCACVPVCMP